jgi:hypothetical protein
MLNTDVQITQSPVQQLSDIGDMSSPGRSWVIKRGLSAQDGTVCPPILAKPNLWGKLGYKVSADLPQDVRGSDQGQRPLQNKTSPHCVYKTHLMAGVCWGQESCMDDSGSSAIRADEYGSSGR